MGVWVFGETCLFLKVFQIILHDLDAWSCGVSTTTNQFPKHPPGVAHQLISEIKSMQFNAAPTGWGLNTVLTLVPATWSKFTYACDQMAKMWMSHDPSIFNKSVELVTRLRKILTYYSQINIHENLQTVKWRSIGQSRNGGVWNFHSLVEHSTLTLHHCIPTWNTLWSK